MREHDGSRERATDGATPSAAPESTKVHGDKLEELIPRSPPVERSERAGSRAIEEGDGEEPRGHS